MGGAMFNNMSVALSLFQFIIRRIFTMQSQSNLNTQTSGQLGPNCTQQNIKGENATRLVINGCTVTFMPEGQNTNNSFTIVKEILMSSYRTRINN
jgi:hypothetical protein